MSKIAIIGANSYLARNFILSLKLKNENNFLLYDIQENQVDDEQDYFQIDFKNPDSLKKIDFKCQLIYIFSGITGTSNGFDVYDKFIEINEIGLLNVLSEYRNQNSEAKIIYPSTRLVYKGQQGRLKENSEKEFKTLYAMNKYACENYLQMYHRMFGVKYTILRLCIPYGTLLPDTSSYGTIDFFTSLGTQGKDLTIYGDGSQRRTLTHITDLCDVLYLAGLDPSCINDIYNIGGDAEISIYEIVKIMASKYSVGIKSIEWPDSALKLESGDTVFDSHKLDSLLGFTYQGDFKKWAVDSHGGKE